MKTTAPIRFAGSELGEARHACAFFNSADEQYRVLLPFIKDGFEKGDRGFHVVDPKHRPDHLKRMEQEGIAVADAESKGQKSKATCCTSARAKGTEKPCGHLLFSRPVIFEFDRSEKL